ncbi:MAG TPA: tetratricopeptide repeat protein [Holophagaceae bacterium]|nr:tetratricopeptide repeat protein [Holophagaceae bacterium]
MPDPRISPILLLAGALALPAAAQAPAPKPPAGTSATTATRQDDPRALMLRARSLQLRDGGDDPKGAAALYRRVIALVPRSAEAHLRLSEALEESNDLDGAIPEARRAIALEPRSGEALGQLGSLLYRKARTDREALPEAITALKAATARLPTDAQMWAYLAQAAEAASDDATALEAWLHLGRLRPDLVPAWERAAIHAWVLKDYAGRREAVMALCDRPGPRPEDLKQLEQLARDQMKSGFLAHAEDSYRLLARHLPNEPGVWESLALVELRIPDYPKALADFQRAEALQENPGTSFNMALCLMNMGRFGEAAARLEALRKVLPASDVPEKVHIQDLVQVIHAEALLLQGEPKDLLADLKADPPRPAMAGDLASLQLQALVETGDFRGAAKALAAGAARYPDRPFFKEAAALPKGRAAREARLRQLDLETLAELKAGFGQWQDCLDTLLRAKALGAPDTADLLLLEANAYDQLDRPEDNLRALRAAQKLAPGNATLQNNLGYLLLDHGGDLKEAAALIEAAVKQEPDNGSFVDSLGWLRFKQGDAQAAETQLRRAAELRPFSADVRQHLGEVLLKLGKTDEAITQWERALAFAFPGHDALEKRLEDVRAAQAKARARAEDTGDDTGAPDGDEE